MDLSKVRLIDFIAFSKLIAPLESKTASLAADETLPAQAKIIKTNALFVGKARIAFNYFSGNSYAYINEMPVDKLSDWYNSLVASFSIELTGEWWKTVRLCPPELTHIAPITFGQFIDAKMIVEAAAKDGRTIWEVVQYLMAIFLVARNKKYDYLYTDESNPQFIRCGKMDMLTAIKVSRWWDLLNKYIHDHFTVFQDSGDSDYDEYNDNMDLHMQRWGWVTFLKNIAKTKAFDIAGSGMNSIDCVRETKASEILVWASEEKEYNVAVKRDMKKK